MTAGRDVARPCRWPCVAAAVLSLSACGDDPTAAEPVCEEAIPLLVEGAVEGALTRTDAVYERAYVDYFGLQIDRPTTVTLVLGSTDVDPFLYAFAADLSVVAQAFSQRPAPRGEWESASLTRTFEPGCHLVGASAWSPGSTGGYSLRAEATRVDVF